MPALSQWLQLMLGEIARKREELERARAEAAARQREAANAASAATRSDVSNSRTG